MTDERWAKWLISTRMEASGVPDKRSVEDEAASDRARVLYSASFRRLQSKAQVFSLDNGSFVRNRLTHSLEVAHTGREIARLVVRDLLEKGAVDSASAAALICKVEVACLIHDIGNPPFGHFGEAAIQQWFDDERGGRACLAKACRSLSVKGKKKKAERALADFLEFDGNPQGFRILTRLTSSFRKTAGLNLTWSQLVAGVKYPRSPQERDTGWKKPGVFLSEARYFRDGQAASGVAPGTRHPLVYMMEAADDISYCLSDIEDGMENELVQPSDLQGDVQTAWRTVIGDPDATIGHLVLFKSEYHRTLVARAARRFVENNAFQQGTAREIFSKECDEARLLDALKALAGKRLFRNPDVEQVELAGFQTLTGLLKHFAPLLEMSGSKFNMLLDAHHDRLSAKDLGDANHLGRRAATAWRLFHMLPPKHLNAYQGQVADPRPDGFTPKTWEWNARAHLVVDFISGMTDKFAVEVFQLLSGMRI